MKTEEKKLTLYDCATLFIETMDDKYPDACEDSAVFLVASNGQKVSGMFNGADDLVCQTLTHYIVKDSGVRSIITSALITAMQYLNDKKDDNIKETVE